MGVLTIVPTFLTKGSQDSKTIGQIPDALMHSKAGMKGVTAAKAVLPENGEQRHAASYLKRQCVDRDELETTTEDHGKRCSGKMKILSRINFSQLKRMADN